MPDKLVQVTDNVWIFPRDSDLNRPQPNVGAVITDQQTILIDAGNSPRHARRILLALDEIQAPSVTYVIYTHSHWDHVFGGMIYGATAIGHELCRKFMAEMANKPWSHSYLQEEIQRTPARESVLREIGRTIEDWRHFRILLPEVTFSRTLLLYPDGVRIELEHVGGQHAADSIIVRLPEARVMFIADCYYPPPAHLRKPEDTLDVRMIRSLLDEDIDVYIDGHGLPLTRADFQRLAAQIG